MTRLLLALLLAGCADPMTRTAPIDKVTVTWVGEVPSECEGNRGAWNGCAHWSGSECTVVMPFASPDWLVAHELKHCFGWRH